jgi:hypothetical protein
VKAPACHWWNIQVKTLAKEIARLENSDVPTEATASAMKCLVGMANDLRSAALCTGACVSEADLDLDSDDGEEEEECEDAEVVKLCVECGHLRRLDVPLTANECGVENLMSCPCCGRPDRQQTSNGRPCIVCRSRWLLLNNGTKQRRDRYPDSGTGGVPDGTTGGARQSRRSKGSSARAPGCSHHATGCNKELTHSKKESQTAPKGDGQGQESAKDAPTSIDPTIVLRKSYCIFGS